MSESTEPKSIGKILVCGFPHSGTSILRVLIGNHDDVYDVTQECDTVSNMHLTEAQKNGASYVVVKMPFTPKTFAKYTSYKIVCIIKNPFDVFGSLHLRFGNKLPSCHTLTDWERFATHWNSLRQGAFPNIMPVRYEDLFDNEYHTIKSIFSFLELPLKVCAQQIVSVSSPVSILDPDSPVPEDCPERKNHGQFRQWQINQPFENKTGQSQHALPLPYKTKLRNMNIVQLIYREYVHM